MLNSNGSEGEKVKPERIELLGDYQQGDAKESTDQGNPEGQLVKPADGIEPVILSDASKVRGNLSETVSQQHAPTSPKGENREPEIVKKLGLREKLDQKLESLMEDGELEYKNGVYLVPQDNSAYGELYILNPKELLKECNLNLANIEFAQQNGMTFLEQLSLPVDAFKLMQRLKLVLSELSVDLTKQYIISEGKDFQLNRDAILRLATLNAHNRGVAIMLTDGKIEAACKQDTTPEKYLVDTKRDGPIDCEGLIDIMLKMKRVFAAIKRGEKVKIPLTNTFMWDPNIEIEGYMWKGPDTKMDETKLRKLVPLVSYSHVIHHKVSFNAFEAEYANGSIGVGHAVRIDMGSYGK